MARLKLEDIRKEISEHNWKIISEEYVNLETTMTFECPEGHRVFAPWKKLRSKLECPVCRSNGLTKCDDEVLPKSKGVKRTLALDQASKVTGYAIFDNEKLVKYGSFSATSDDDVERFALMKSWLISMINNWHPDHIGIEGI